jgi:hypothetical protein
MLRIVGYTVPALEGCFDLLDVLVRVLVMADKIDAVTFTSLAIVEPISEQIASETVI